MTHKFDPKNIDRLMGKEREKELNPLQFLMDNGLAKRMSFADLGCGPGFFAIPAAEIVGTKGIVYAVDMQKEMLDQLRRRKPPKNVKLVKSDENRVPLENGSVDFALLAFVFHEASDRSLFLKEVKRILKKEGILLVLEWEKKIEDKGPPYEERVEKNEAKEAIEAAGFSVKKFTSLNPSHYVVKALNQT